jgi:hypothetical protein
VDTGEVLSFANGFSHAVISSDKNLIATYCCKDVEADLQEKLASLAPLEMAKVLIVTPLGDRFDATSAREFVSVTNLWGRQEEVLLRAVWVQDPQQLLIRRLEIMDRKPTARKHQTQHS